MVIDERALHLGILRGNYGYTLLADAIYWFTHDGTLYEVHIPEGFQTDLASLPPIAGLLALSNADPRLVAPAILHDYLYRTGAIFALNHNTGSVDRIILNRREKDAIFWQKMVDFALPRWKAWLVWAAVRLFGWMA